MKSKIAIKSSKASEVVNHMALILLLGCGPTTDPQDKSTPTPTPPGQHLVNVGHAAISLDAARWRAMPNEFDWAENFEEISRDASHVFPRVLTVFKLPMTLDRRVGLRISDSEFLEIFSTTPESLTIQIRSDRNSFWLLIRETVDTRGNTQLSEIALDRIVTDQEVRQAASALQPLIDNTRYLLAKL